MREGNEDGRRGEGNCNFTPTKERDRPGIKMLKKDVVRSQSQGEHFRPAHKKRTSQRWTHGSVAAVGSLRQGHRSRRLPDNAFKRTSRSGVQQGKDGEKARQFFYCQTECGC